MHTTSCAACLSFSSDLSCFRSSKKYASAAAKTHQSESKQTTKRIEQNSCKKELRWITPYCHPMTHQAKSSHSVRIVVHNTKCEQRCMLNLVYKSDMHFEAENRYISDRCGFYTPIRYAVRSQSTIKELHKIRYMQSEAPKIVNI